MQRVTGIGGIFFKARDPVALRAWYQTHLGIEVLPWGGAAFRWLDASGQPAAGTTIWCITGMADEGEAAPPAAAPFVINYRVADLTALLQALRNEGCEVLDQTESSEHGQFGWVIDPEGNKLELWQPPPGQ